MNTAAAILHELAAIKNYLIAAQDVVKSGHMPDMRGLENRVAMLCESIQKADKDTQQQCLPQLAELLDQLNGCESGLKAWQDPSKGGTA